MKVCLRRRGEAAEPAHDFVGVGVRRHRVDALDPRGDRDPRAVDLDALLAVDQTASARAGRLVAGEEHGVPRVRQRRLEMVQHAPAFRHPARRDDDGRHLRSRQLLRLFRVADDAEPLGAEDAHLALLHRLAAAHVRRMRRGRVVRRLVVVLLRLQLGVELLHASV
jgi:hypothetical protein